MDRMLVWVLLWVLVILAFATFLALAARSRRRAAGPPSPMWERREDVADAYDASQITGYMAGNRQRIEHRDDTTISRVEPPRSARTGPVDLDAGTLHVRRDTSG